MLLNVQARIALAPAPVSDLPLYRVKHWYETGDQKESNRPEVVRLDPFEYTEMDEAFQWLCFDLLFWDIRAGNRSYITADEKRIFNSVYEGDTFITNFNGVEQYRNYITGERMGEPLPKYMNIVMGGAMIAGEEYIGTGGERRVLVSTLQAAAPASSLAPWQVMHATIFTTTILASGAWQVNPFAQRGGRLGSPVIVPLYCSVPCSIALAKLERLAPGSPTPNPYIPPCW